MKIAIQAYKTINASKKQVIPEIIKENSLLVFFKDKANIPLISAIINPGAGRLKSESLVSKISLPTKILYLTIKGKFAAGTKNKIKTQAAKLSKKGNAIKYFIPLKI